MFSHIMIGVNDLEISRSFYDATLQILGYRKGVLDPKGRYFYFGGGNILALTKPINGEPASHGNGATIGFSSESPEQVDSWYASGLANGGVSCEDPPGIRKSGKFQLYLAYLRDPADNKVCAMYRYPKQKLQSNKIVNK